MRPRLAQTLPRIQPLPLHDITHRMTKIHLTRRPPNHHRDRWLTPLRPVHIQMHRRRRLGNEIRTAVGGHIVGIGRVVNGDWDRRVDRDTRVGEDGGGEPVPKDDDRLFSIGVTFFTRKAVLVRHLHMPVHLIRVPLPHENNNLLIPVLKLPTQLLLRAYQNWPPTRTRLRHDAQYENLTLRIIRVPVVMVVPIAVHH